MRLRYVFILTLMFQLLASFAWADEIQMGLGVNSSEPYEARVKSIVPGDTLRFSNHQTFTVGQVLGHGNTTVIYSLADDPSKVLRVPLHLVGRGYTDGFNGGAKVLEKAGVPMVKVYETYDDEYSVVEKLPLHMTFSDFVEINSEKSFLAKSLSMNWWGNAKPPQNVKDEMIAKFILFAEKISEFQKIGDMHSGNLIYDLQKKEWRLMDWDFNSWSARDHVVAGQTFFSQNSPLASLLESYGYTDKMQFKAKSNRYQWLQTMIAQAHDAIQKKRQHPSAGVCARVFAN